jgi:hypothetical protein
MPDLKPIMLKSGLMVFYNWLISGLIKTSFSLLLSYPDTGRGFFEVPLVFRNW